MNKFLTPLFLFVLSACVSTQQEADAVATKKVDRGGIRKSITAHNRYIRDCYGKTLLTRGNEQLKGKVMMNFEIGPDGRAHNPQVDPNKSTIHDKNLNQCLIKGLKSWDFPVHPDGKNITVNYPIRFNARPPKNMQKKMDHFENLRRINSMQ